MSESDGIDEAIEGMSRVGPTVAGRLGEQLARAREQALRVEGSGAALRIVSGPPD